MISPQIARAGGDPLVVVGGLDPTGGAGILRDVATANALGAAAHAVGTAWTEQGAGVHKVEARAPEALGEALAYALRATPPAAVKIGMAVSPATAAALIDALDIYDGPIVIDPVLATSRGGKLWHGPPRGLLPLLRLATLVTPNAPELAALAGTTVSTLSEAEAAGRRLVERDAITAILIKGGHLAESAPQVTDLLVTAAATTPFTRRRVAGSSPRGTGCALATAIAVFLSRGESLPNAVESATRWLGDAIARATDRGGERHLP